MKIARITAMDEVPLRNDQYNVQGHTDGLIDIDECLEDDIVLEKKPRLEISKLHVLEIKSINESGFKELNTPDPKHVMQASTYCWCLEERRKYLKEQYSSWKKFYDSSVKRHNYFVGVYSHLPVKRLEEKVQECLLADTLLYSTKQPIDMVIYLYESKNTQEIKEFDVPFNEELMEDLKHKFREITYTLNLIRIMFGGRKVTTWNKKLIKLLPEKDGTSKSCFECKWCGYRELCWM